MLFDIEFVTRNFQVCNLSHYIGLIQSASTSELREFRRQVKSHEKGAQKSLAFSNVAKLTTHGVILAAINYELLKRSKVRHKIWSIVLPVRQFLVRNFSGVQLELHQAFGALYVEPV